ncbi:hypothetical protein MUK42_01522 [Musa troglodytarum]|uniref:Uncharacterized protein n=1 Tax=Musa troglodytarum TaxID=320322 RepID=A0A9E7G299_9LILI|nr:hypothetical protein MUK42_01522 [Musa troglodytarum]
MPTSISESLLGGHTRLRAFRRNSSEGNARRIKEIGDVGSGEGEKQRKSSSPAFTATMAVFHISTSYDIISPTPDGWSKLYPTIPSDYKAGCPSFYEPIRNSRAHSRPFQVNN